MEDEIPSQEMSDGANKDAIYPELTGQSLPAQAPAPPGRLVVPDEALGGLLPLRNYLGVSG
jgi:hypothetical protein